MSICHDGKEEGGIPPSPPRNIVLEEGRPVRARARRGGKASQSQRMERWERDVSLWPPPSLLKLYKGRSSPRRSFSLRVCRCFGGE